MLAEQKAGLTQVQVAERIGVTQKPVSTLESGYINKFRLPTISAYIHATGAALDVTVTLKGKTHHIAGDHIQAAWTPSTNDPL